MDDRQKIPCRFLVARGDAATLFDGIDEALDDIAFLVCLLVVGAFLMAIAARRNDRLGTGRLDLLDKPIAVVCFVSDLFFASLLAIKAGPWVTS